MKVILFSREINDLEDDSDISQRIKSELNLNADAKFRFLFPIESKYKLEQIKALIKAFSKKIDAENEFISIIMHAELLTDVAQNALLKTLEESDYSVILVTSNLDSILPTVISRCQVVTANDTQEVLDLDQTELTLNSIPHISKISRKEVIQILSNKMNMKNINNISIYQDAINKINSNCKIESVLFEVIYKESRI